MPAGHEPLVVTDDDAALRPLVGLVAGVAHRVREAAGRVRPQPSTRARGCRAGCGGGTFWAAEAADPHSRRLQLLYSPSTPPADDLGRLGSAARVPRPLRRVPDGDRAAVGLPATHLPHRLSRPARLLT